MNKRADVVIGPYNFAHSVGAAHVYEICDHISPFRLFVGILLRGTFSLRFLYTGRVQNLRISAKFCRNSLFSSRKY